MNVRSLVYSRQIYIFPSLNPDGAEYDIATGNFRMWRKNRRDNGDGTVNVRFSSVDQDGKRTDQEVRVDRDLRIIIHKTAASILLAYVAHHDRAYDWAERRRIEAHPKTGAVQIVEVREARLDAVGRLLDVLVARLLRGVAHGLLEPGAAVQLGEDDRDDHLRRHQQVGQQLAVEGDALVHCVGGQATAT